MKNFIAILLLLIVALAPARATTRDPAQVRDFRREHACPATGQFRGACPGWVVDHVIPLSLYGEDTPANMQWQRRDEALAKDKLEWAAARKKRKILEACQTH